MAEEEREFQGRQTAIKVWIADVLGGNYIKQEGWSPNYIELGGKQVSRVNVLATVVSKFMSEDGNYGVITLDDGTETIRVKGFGPDVIKLRDAKIGAIVQFIGKIKEYNEERYFAPEIVREVEDPNWIVVRKLELGKPKSPTATQTKTITVDEKKAEEEIKKEVENMSKTVFEMIRKLDSGNGADLKQLIKTTELDEEEVKNIVVGLLKSGDIFEPRKGFLKILE